MYENEKGMKLRICLLLLPIACLSSCKDKINYHPHSVDPTVTYDDVYLIMGQSNASGVSQHIYLASEYLELYDKYTQGNSQVLISYDVDNRFQRRFVPTKFGFGNTEEFFGPEIGIADTLSKNGETSYIIKATLSGSCLQSQYVDKNGFKKDLYHQFIDFIDGQLNVLKNEGKNPRLRGMFWMQGESDSVLENTSTYKTAEKYFVDYLRNDLNDYIYDYFNFVDAYISTHTTAWTYPTVINECKQQLAEENDHWYCIKTNGEDESALNLFLKYETHEDDGDIAHYDSKSMLLLGQTAGQYLNK